MGLLLVVIWVGVTGLKKTRVVYLLDLFEEREENRAVWFSVDGEPLEYWVNGGYVDIYSRVAIVVLFMWRVHPILQNGYGN